MRAAVLPVMHLTWRPGRARAAAPAARPAYLAEVRKALREAGPLERTAVLARVEALLGEDGDPRERLGPAEALVLACRRDWILARAVTGYHPVFIVRAILEWAIDDVAGILAAFAAAAGCLISLGCLALALLKTAYPASTGLWIGRGTLGLGFEPFPHPGAREVMGFGFAPAAALASVSLFLLTTAGARAFLRRKGRRKACPICS
jgi:hypothetical protein